MPHRRAAQVAGYLVLALVAIAPPARAATIADVLDCVLANLPPAGHASAKLITRASANGPERTIEFEYWSLQIDPGVRRVVIARRGVPADKVSAYLFSDGEAIGEAWKYKKSVGKPTRVHAHHGAEAHLFGTNLTLEDFARTARVVFPGEVRKLADASVDGRPVYVVQTKPAPDAESEYSRIVTSIEQEHCLPLRRESFDPKFEKGERPRKIYTVGPDDVKVSGKYAVAVRAQLDDAKDGSQTRLVVDRFDLPPQVDPSFFTPEALARAGQ